MASAPVHHRTGLIARESQVVAMDEAIELLAGVREAQPHGTSGVGGDGGQVKGLPAEDGPTGEASANAGAVLAGVGSSL
jgi:hypothetical protein